MRFRTAARPARRTTAHERPFRGFTLIEVMLTTALTAVILIAVLGVTASLGRSQKALARHADQEQGHGEIVELLRRDLAQAQEARFSQGGVEIIGFGALDPATLEPSQRPATIVYRLVSDRDGSWVVREQTLLDQSKGSPWREIVGWGVRAFEIEPVLSEGAAEPTSAASVVPQEVRIEMQWASGPPLQEVIRVR